MMFLKKLELEWKILFLASALFIAFAWPVQMVFVARLTATLEQSLDPKLESLLRAGLAQADEAEHSAIIASLERTRQWKALIPIIVREQRQAVFAFSIALFVVFFLLALWTLKGLTRPMKKLARAVERIGQGERAEVVPQSGGALGTVEQAVVDLQDELDVLRERARMQGMETAWQDIARVMAHEIKNPLTPMRLTLDRVEERVLEGKSIDAAAAKKFIDRINSQTDVLERLVNQFRSFSREPEARLRSVAAHDTVRSVAGDVAGKIATSIEGQAIIMADPYLLNQVLLNVWKNSLEAGASAMHVTISRRDGTVEIAARDNGPGIDSKKLDQVWLPYVSTKRGGTGLGLPVVRRLVETMGGKVLLRSQQGEKEHGLTVVMTFRRAEEGAVGNE